MMMSTSAYPATLLLIHLLWIILLDTCSGEVILEVSPYPARIYAGAPADVPVLTVHGFDNLTGFPVTSFDLGTRSDANFFKIDSRGIIKTSQTINFDVGRVFEFMVRGVFNNQSCTESCFDTNDTTAYQHVQIIVSEKNLHAPKFNLPTANYLIYRYGLGNSIVYLNVTDDDVEPYNKAVTLFLNNGQAASSYLSIGSDRYLRLQRPVPDQVKALNVTVWATDSGSPQYTSSAQVNINIASVREPYIFCISTTLDSVNLCWKNPMPHVPFDGYNVTVASGGINRTVSLPAIPEHIESCYSVNETGLNITYVFKVVVRTTELSYGGDFQIMFNKTRPAGFTKACETEGFAICSYTNICNGHGECINHSPTNYTCNCNRDWRGRNCESQDMCAYSPCGDNEKCMFTGHQTYTCSCLSESYYGLNCQYFNQCLDQPCQNSGTCLTLDDGSYRCECPSGFTGDKCQIEDPCSPFPCTANRGTCKPVSGDQYKCECLVGYYGDKCEKMNACLLENEPCSYQGTCIPVGDGFTCVCPPVATGERCKYLDPCYLQPCLNSGNCTNGPMPGTYVCQCLPGFTGNECQHKNHCFGVNCNNGQCKLDSAQKIRCECRNGFYGENCDRFDVCLTSPCKNQGTCTSTGPTIDTRNIFTCSCPEGWSGVDCSEPRKCSVDICKNGGTCKDTLKTVSQCICRDGYYMDDCSAFNPCSRHDCQNGASCRNVSQENFTCECQENWLGDLCQVPSPCSPGRDPCRNGGECQVVDLLTPGTTTPASIETYSPQCKCKKGFTGKNCQIDDPCISSPCIHGDCQIDADSGDDDAVDFSVLADVQYICFCYQNFTGRQCERPVDSCAYVQCLNEGVCRHGLCLCPSGFTGSRCEQELPDCPDTDTLDSTGEPCVVDEAMRNLQSLLDDTSDPSRLTVEQVLNFTDQLVNLYNHTLRDPKYAWTAFCVLGNLAKVNVSVCEVAESTNKVNTRLREFLDNYTSEVRLDGVSGQINITSPELHVEAVALRKLLEGGSDTVSFQPYVTDNNTSAEINLEIRIPSEILADLTNESADTRLQFVGYKRSQLFVPADGFSPASFLHSQPVISATLKGREIRNLTRPVEIHLFNTTAGRNYTCVFWDTDASVWSSEGLTMQSHDTEGITCTSSHLTSFAILLNVNEEQTIDQKHELILTYLTYIGCAISTACLLFTIITYAMFKCLNNEKSGKILLQLCTALLLLNVTFLAATVDVSRFSEEACLTVGMLLHYFVLASLMWMLAEAVEMYQALVTVFSKYERLYLVKRCLLAWGIPVIIVAITAGVSSGSYYDEKDKKNFCFLTSKSTVAYYTSLVAPSCAILLVNIFVFIMVARVILKPNFQQQLMNNTTSITPAQIRGAFTVMFLLGITWVFGPLAINEAQTAFSYLFCICNSLQGFLIFVFRCLFNPEAKMAWMQLLYMGTLKRKRGPIKSVYTDSTSKGDNRRASSSNTSGFLGSSTTRTTVSKSGNGFHPHPHQLHTTNGWHPNLNGLKRDKTQKEGSESLSSRDFSSYPEQKRKLSSEESPPVKRHSLTNESTETLQDEQTHL